MAWHGMAWHGMAWHGMDGMAWHGFVAFPKNRMRGGGRSTNAEVKCQCQCQVADTEITGDIYEVKRKTSEPYGSWQQLSGAGAGRTSR
jgi:hypothetical protein